MHEEASYECRMVEGTGIYAAKTMLQTRLAMIVTQMTDGMVD